MSDAYNVVLAKKEYKISVPFVGKTGLNAYQLAVANGFEGTVQEWLESLTGPQGPIGPVGPQGIDGSSAYDIAVANGFEGTEEEWLNFLNGSSWKNDIAAAIATKGILATGGDTKEQFINNIDLIIENGIRFNALNESGMPTDITLFGSVFPTYLLRNPSYIGPYVNVITCVFANDNVQIITTEMFYGCIALENINIPDTVEQILQGAFYACRALLLTSLPSSLTYIGSSAFTNCYAVNFAEVPIGVTTLNDGCFWGCTALENVNIPGATEIRYNAFRNCSGLQSVVVGSPGHPVSQIRLEAFYNCLNLLNITIYTVGGEPLPDSPWGATNAEITYLEA